mgnify:CR=1 FL=1
MNPLFHPIRYRIIKLLLVRQLTSCKEVAEALDIDEDTASFHLAKLDIEKLVISEAREGEKCYRLNEDELFLCLEEAQDEIRRMIRKLYMNRDRR